MSSDISMMSEYEFFLATGLYTRARDKYEELGWIAPRYRDGERNYSQADAEFVCTIKRFLDGNTDLKTAYQKAIQELQREAA